MIDVATETMLTLTEAARQLGKSRETVRLWMKQQLLESVKLNGRWHTSAEALRRFAELPGEEELPVSPARLREEDRRALETLRALGVAN